jgi:hypothetical protein
VTTDESENRRLSLNYEKKNSEIYLEKFFFQNDKQHSTRYCIYYFSLKNKIVEFLKRKKSNYHITKAIIDQHYTLHLLFE